LNLDMVGRNAEDSLQIIGSPEESFLVQIARKENASIGLVLENTVLASGGSDHVSYQKRKIPVLFFHSDEHEDYHKVSDEAKFINEKKIARVSNLVFRTVWNISTSSDPRIYPLSRGKK